MKNEKPWYKKWWVFLLGVVILAIIIAIPFVINGAYLKGTADGQPNTAFSASDIILFYGSVLTFVGTVSLGALALWQNKKANEINMRILKIEEISNVPFLHIDSSNSRINCISAHEVDIVIGLRNMSNGIINIAEVSDMKYDLFLLSQNDVLPFCKGWTKHYSVLPNQFLPINFFKEVKKVEKPIIDRFDEVDKVKFFQMHCDFSVTIHFVNSKEKYKQQYELILNCYRKNDDRNYVMSIDSIENSIVKQEEK